MTEDDSKEITLLNTLIHDKQIGLTSHSIPKGRHW